jgi:diguanylate cyclase (GGDEF)-like protein/PAS domain S-box-containing protein
MEMQHNFEAIVENMHDGLYFVDSSRQITYWNKAAERITGFAKSEVIGRYCADNILIHVDNKGCELCTDLCPLAATLKDGIFREDEIFLHHKSGHRVAVAVRVTPLQDPAGNIIGAIELFSESNSQIVLKQKIIELERLALLDHLTELPNRRHLNMELIAQSALCERTEGYSFGILFFDIDRFKRVNDREGHDVGDKTLQVIAKTISGSIRPFDTIGRWGGEEFLGIFPSITHEELSKVAERLLVLVRASSVETPHGLIKVTVSVGGTVSKGSEDIDALIKRADALMYKSKDAGRNRATIE